MSKLKIFELVQEMHRKQHRKPRVGSLLKRFVTTVIAKQRDIGNAADRSCAAGVPLFKKSPNRGSSSNNSHKITQNVCLAPVLSQQTQQQLLPEILKVSPMCTSCEVTLISSTEDRPETHRIIVTQDGKSPTDNSYHMVLNPHRAPRTKFDVEEEDEDVEETRSGEMTHDITTGSCRSFDLNGYDNKTTPTLSFAYSQEDEINFVNGEETDFHKEAEIYARYLRDREDFMIQTQNDTMVYKSLFVDSDLEDECEDENDSYLFVGDDEAEELDADVQFVENYLNWRSDNEASKVVQARKELLNTTIDTALLEDIEDESLSFRDDDLPIEILVQSNSQF